jgi:glucose-1-phosphate adenylyltransferase
VMILAQYRPHSLIEHIGAGGPWDLTRDFTGGVRIYTPYKGRGGSDWYLGTADAVQQNYRFIKHTDPDLILVLSGDHIYTMNYASMIEYHHGHQADLTIASIRVPLTEANRFGILDINEENRITSFMEKPSQPPTDLANMGVYLFNQKVLDEALWQDHISEDTTHDFGRDILPRMISEGKRVFAYPYDGYWVDVGTLDSYWHAHMVLLDENPPIDLNNRKWVIHTRTEERPPVRFFRDATVIESMVADGCVIEPNAYVERSILSPGVQVKSGARISHSIVLTDTIIEPGAIIANTVIDKYVKIGGSCRIGQAIPGEPLKITMIGKNSQLPANLTVEAGAVIGTDLIGKDFPGPTVHGDDFIQTKRKPHEI